MSTVTITPEPESEGNAKVDDAAFAAGQTVGRFETHMGDCMAKHAAHDAMEGELSARIAAVEALTMQTAVVADVAASAAVDAVETSEEAVDEAEAIAESDADDSGVIEMEMPEIHVETPSEEPKKKKGFSLW